MLTYLPAMLSAVTASSDDGWPRIPATAMDLYEQAYDEGRRGHFWSALRRRPGRLDRLALTAAEVATLDRYDAGLQTVPIAQIRGSEGRGVDFDADFHPLQEHTRERWLSIARARLLDAAVPPIELIQVGAAYFVRDGHHRLSVARALGEEFIEAHVTVWTTRPQRAREQSWSRPFTSLATATGRAAPATRAAIHAIARREAAQWRPHGTGA